MTNGSFKQAAINMKGDHITDPWGRPYQYECPGQHNTESYDLWSLGKDAQAGTDDDVANFGTD